MQDNQRKRFLEEIRAKDTDKNKEIERKKFLLEIYQNKELLGKLSLDRLFKLKEYYDTIIKENNKKLAQVKNS